VKIQVILSSTRPGRVGERVAKWVTAVAADRHDFDVELVDLADFDLPHLDEAVSPRFNPDRRPNPAAARWLAKVAEADGYVIVTPEYNHSIPAILKTAIDYLDFQFAKKPAAIVSYGTVGGARAAEHLKGILIEARAAVVPEAVALLGRPDQLFSPGGTFMGDTSKPTNPVTTLQNVLGELAWWTATLKAGRNTLAAARR
jgi:NAD(P)H-dependent FMN reductase